MLKKHVSVFCVLLLLISMLSSIPVSVSAEDGFTSGYYNYIILNDGTVSVEKYTGAEKSVSIPPVIDGKTVTVIGEWAFAGSSVENVALPRGITKICSFAFYNTSKLKNITLPGTLTEIGSTAFQASGLICVNIPDNVKSIGNWGFAGCTSLINVSLGKSVESIGVFAFNNCTALQSINFPSGIKNIDTYAFQNCSSLEAVVIPAGLESMGINAFASNTNLKSVIIGNGLKYVSDDTFKNCRALEHVILPGSIEGIYNGAFAGCEKMKTIKIPENVSFIGNNAIGFNGNENKLNDFIIYGYSDTTAGEYAQKYGFEFVDLKNKIFGGDINGDGNTDLYDILLIQQSLADLITLNGQQFFQADVTVDGEVDLRDILKIQKYMAELIEKV